MPQCVPYHGTCQEEFVSTRGGLVRRVEYRALEEDISHRRVGESLR